MEKIFFKYVEFYKFLPTPLFDHRLDDRGGKRLTHRCSLLRPVVDDQ